MELSSGELDHHLHVSRELKRQHDIHRLRDELGLDPEGTIEHITHLEKYLPQERWFGPHTKKLWLEFLAASLNCHEVPFFIDDPLGQWLLRTWPDLGYEVNLETYVRDNLAVARLRNIAQEIHEAALELARNLEFIELTQDERIVVPDILHGHELKRLHLARALQQLPGVRDAQPVLGALVTLYNSSDALPPSFPNLRAQGKHGWYNPKNHLVYVDLSNAWQPNEERYLPHTLQPALVNELRHYFVHYLDDRILHRLGSKTPNYFEDKVYSPYLLDLHREVLV